MGISPARTAAFDVLQAIETKRAFSSIVLPPFEERLSPPDRGLCHEAVLGVLRRQMLLDRVIDELTAGRKLDVEVRIALRLGVFQLLYLDRVPPHAAVNDSVSLVVRAKKSSAKGLVNAVLRKVTQAVPELRFSDDTERISVETSHPRWLLEKWRHDLGPERAEQIAIANNAPPVIAFRKTLKGREVVLNKNYRESGNVSGCYKAERLEPELRWLADAALIYFQDEASQMVAAAVEIRPPGRFLDVCAAPGGKTTAIAARDAVGELFVAGDKYHSRTVFLKENCHRQGVAPVNVVEYDATAELPFADETFDSILIDAPCSGTGTIRHNPELRYFIEPADLGRLQRTQLAILTGASKVLKQGGSLVYSTCSLEREENEDVIGSFLSENKGFELIKPDVPDRFITGGGYARTFPDRDDMDGFFIAKLRRA